MTISNILPISKLRKLVRADFQKGELFWLERTIDQINSDDEAVAMNALRGFNNEFPGKKALNSGKPNGARTGHILGVKYRADSVIWALYHGEWPSSIPWHKNNVLHDNRIENLFLNNRIENLFLNNTELEVNKLR